jgi:signal transduction histidine kinase
LWGHTGMDHDTPFSGGRAEAAPRGLLQAVLDALKHHIALLSPAGNVVLANEAWRRSAASERCCGPRGAIGTNYAESFKRSSLGESIARRANEGIAAVLTHQSGEFSLDYACDDANQTKWWFHMTVTPCDISGAVHAVIAHEAIASNPLVEEKFREHTAELVREIEQYKRTETELRRLIERKDHFFTTLLHELRNPLAPIANAIQLLVVHPDDRATVNSARGIIQRQLRSLTRLVDDLLDVSRIGRGSVNLRRHPVDLTEVVATSVETARPLIELRRHQVSTTAQARLFVEGDAVRLGQVLTNLLINAAKYTEPGGFISVIAERISNEAVIRVRDNGIGIAPELLPQIFDLFAQGAPRSEAARGGLGVGLAVARQLVELHGGSITVQSAGPGRGSEFAIRLPALLQQEGIRP